MNNNSYYFKDSGQMYRGWLDLQNNSYYLDINTGIMATGFRELGGKTFYFGNDGIMRKGWVELNGDSRYFNELGRMVRGWLELNNNSYYFKESGDMYRGWLDLGSNSYYLDINNGIMATGFRELGGKTFYFGDNGIMRKGWININSNSYYFNDLGRMQKGWNVIGGNKYYFEYNGILQRNKVIGEYYLNSEGIGNLIVEEGVYGQSGEGRNLNYYRIGHGKKVLLAIFGVHGFEDAWDKDSEELKTIAENTINNLKEQYKSQERALDLSEWSIYIIPSANPDGRLDGWTNYGPGRATITTHEDINRSFPIGFKPYYSDRNYTGSRPLGSPEAKNLYNFINNAMDGASEKVLLDIHGWENKTIGDYSIGKYFDNEFGFRHISSYPGGFIITYGRAIGARSVLLEFPMPSSHYDVVRRNFSGKFIDGLTNILINN